MFHEFFGVAKKIPRYSTKSSRPDNKFVTDRHRAAFQSFVDHWINRTNLLLNVKKISQENEFFTAFGLTRPGIKLFCTVSEADSLSTVLMGTIELVTTNMQGERRRLKVVQFFCQINLILGLLR